MRQRTVLSLLVMWAWIGIVAPVFGETYADKIAAIVNGDVILVSDIHKYRQPGIRKIAAVPLGIIPPSKWPTEKEILDELIVTRLIDQEANRKGIVVDDKAVDATIDSIRERNKMTRDQFIVYLAANGVSYSDYRNITKRQVRLSSLLRSEVAAKIPLNEEDAQEYFKQNKGQIAKQYQQLVESMMPAQPPEQEVKPDIPTHETRYEGGQVRLRQITLKIPSGSDRASMAKIMEKARQIHRDAITGADFAQLAKKYSQDELAASGGDLGLLHYKDLHPNVQQLVQRLKTGDITPPLQKPGAVIIFNLSEAKGRTEKKVPIPEKVRKQLEQQWKEAMAKRAPPRPPAPRTENEPVDDTEEKTRNPRNPSNPDAKPTKSLGILTPAEEKEYQRERAKVVAILRSQKSQARMKEWIEELKKNSIIEVKL